MNPEELKVLCLKTAIPTCKCVKKGCNEPPVAFLMFGDEFQVCCRKHFEISTFYHDGFDRYNTAKGSETRYTVYLGLETVYIYTYHDLNPINRYINVQKVLLSRQPDHEDDPNVDAILLELKRGFYLLIADYLCVFETEDEIQALYSHRNETGNLSCGAVGDENVYLFPYGEPGSHSTIEKRLYPREMEWRDILTFQSTDVLLNQRQLHSTLLVYSNEW